MTDNNIEELKHMIEIIEQEIINKQNQLDNLIEQYQKLSNISLEDYDN